MKKSDLKTGMVVELRNGGKYLVLLNAEIKHNRNVNVIANLDGSSWSFLDSYNEDLTNTVGKHLDIVKVELLVYVFHLATAENNPTTVIWVRTEPKEMTVAEIEAELGYKVKIVEG